MERTWSQYVFCMEILTPVYQGRIAPRTPALTILDFQNGRSPGRLGAYCLSGILLRAALG